MAIRERLSGNEAVAYAIRQVDPDVMPAFPITPSTEIPQYVANYIANGEIDTEFIHVESEHSAMSATVGASAAGARAVTATSSCGMALMWEELYVAASNRLPIVLALVNRALSGPININADHSDSMGARDSGWIQIYAESNQEVYDNYIQAFPIAEDKRVHLPVMVCQDGFITSHGVVIIGSAAGTCKAAVDEIRNTTGKRVGLIKIRVFRPFPEEEIAKALSGVKAAAVMDRSEMFAAAGGPLGAEVRAALYQAHGTAEVVNYFYGLGGRDITVSDFKAVYDRLETIARTHIITDMYEYIGLRSAQTKEV